MKAIIVLLVVLGLAAGGATELLFHNRIYPHMHIAMANVDVGGHTQDDVKVLLHPFSVKQRFRTIELDVPRGALLLVPAYELGYGIDGSATAQRAYAVARDGSLPQRLVAQLRTLFDGATVALAQQVDGQVLRAYLLKLAPSLNRRPYRGLPGRRLDIDRAQQEITRLLLTPGSFAVDLPFTSLHAPAPAHYHSHLGLKQHVASR